MGYEPYHFVATEFHEIIGGDVLETQWYGLGDITCRQYKCMGFGVGPSQPFKDSSCPENIANDTCLALLLFKLDLICMEEKMPSMVAGIQ